MSATSREQSPRRPFRTNDDRVPKPYATRQENISLLLILRRADMGLTVSPYRCKIAQKAALAAGWKGVAMKRRSAWARAFAWMLLLTFVGGAALPAWGLAKEMVKADAAISVEEL